MILPTTEELLLQIKGFIKDGHKLEGDRYAVIHLDDNSEWKLESVRYGNEEESILPHIALYNIGRCVSFYTDDELRGWLRCYRSFVLTDKYMKGE